MEADRPLLTFRLDPRTGIAPYRQLVDQVRQAVILGLLEPGDRLPSVREVVTQVTINPNTVHRAYRDLEHEGVVEGRPGLGTFVVGSSRSPADTSAQDSLLAELREWLARARQAGLDDERVAALFAAAVHPGETVTS
jgi:GntR family transcriptional regulator